MLPAISEDEEEVITRDADEDVGGDHGNQDSKDPGTSSPTLKRKSLPNGHVDNLSV